MSVPKDRGPDPHADPLLAAVLRAAPEQEPASCPDAEVLALYAERELPGDEHGPVEAHVATCARCQATVAAYLRGTPDQDAVAVAGTSPVPWWSGWRWLVPLASATAVLAVVVWIGRGPAGQVAEQARVTDPPPADTAAPPAEVRALEPRQEARAKSAAVPVKKAVPPSPARADAASNERATAAAGPPAAAAPAARAANTVGAAAALAADLSTLTGTVTYRARIALPAGAVVEVRLLDVSRANATATTLARTEIVTRGEQVPVAFALRYDASAVQPGQRYIVEATIAIDGRITWRTTTQHPALAATSPAPITVVVDPVP